MKTRKRPRPPVMATWEIQVAYIRKHHAAGVDLRTLADRLRLPLDHVSQALTWSPPKDPT